MQLLTFEIAAGETKVFQIAGRYIEIIDATSPVDLLLYDTASGRSDELRNALSGLYLQAPFVSFEVYSERAQRLSLLVTAGQGGSRRQPGNVTVIDALGSTVQTVGGEFKAVQPAMTAVQIVAPAANVRGMVLRQVGVDVQAGAGGTVSSRLVAAPAPPTGFTGNLFPLVPVSSSGAYEFANLPDIAKRIPPGWGLYLFYNVTVAPALVHSYSVSYELEP